MKYILNVPLEDNEFKTNATTLAGALEDAKRFNSNRLAENPNYDYSLVQVENLESGRIFEVVSYPGKQNRAEVEHTVTEYDKDGNEVRQYDRMTFKVKFFTKSLNGKYVEHKEVETHRESLAEAFDYAVSIGAAWNKQMAFRFDTERTEQAGI